MALWDSFKGWFDHDREQFYDHPIPAESTDTAGTPRILSAGKGYFRIRIADQFLAKDVQGARNWFPALQSLIRVDFGNAQQAELPNLLDTSTLFQQQGGTGTAIVRDISITPAVPFNGGNIDLLVGLMAISKQNYLDNFFSVLGDFAKLIQVPQFSTALDLAKPLASGIQALYGAGQGHMHLALRQSFGDGQMTSRYVAVVRATEKDVPKQKLVVVNHQLRIGDKPTLESSKPLEKFDYLLLRFDVFEQRDDWDKLTFISEPLGQAIDLLGEPEGDTKKADEYVRVALRAAYKAPELTRADRIRVVEAIKEQYRVAKNGIGTLGLVREEKTLARIVANAIEPSDAVRLREPRFEDTFLDAEE